MDPVFQEYYVIFFFYELACDLLWFLGCSIFAWLAYDTAILVPLRILYYLLARICCLLGLGAFRVAIYSRRHFKFKRARVGFHNYLSSPFPTVLDDIVGLWKTNPTWKYWPDNKFMILLGLRRRIYRLLLLPLDKWLEKHFM